MGFVLVVVCSVLINSCVVDSCSGIVMIMRYFDQFGEQMNSFILNHGDEHPSFASGPSDTVPESTSYSACTVLW